MLFLCCPPYFLFSPLLSLFLVVVWRHKSAPRGPSEAGIVAQCFPLFPVPPFILGLVSPLAPPQSPRGKAHREGRLRVVFVRCCVLLDCGSTESVSICLKGKQLGKKPRDKEPSTYFPLFLCDLLYKMEVTCSAIAHPYPYSSPFHS